MSDTAYYGPYFSYTAWQDDIKDSVVTALWQEIRSGGSWAETFARELDDGNQGILQDKLLREISHAAADRDTALRLVERACWAGLIGPTPATVDGRHARLPPSTSRNQATSKRSMFITLSHAATKSCTNFASASLLP